MKKLILFILIFGFNFTYAYTGLPDSLGKGLVGWWTFNGGDISNGAILDRSGNSRTGTPANIATSTFYAPGEVGQAVNFDGVNDEVSMPVAGATGTLGSVSAWVYTYASSTQQAVLTSSATADTTHELRFSINNTSCGFQCMTIVENNGGTANVVRGGTEIKPLRWYHLVWTSNGSTYKMYVNGVAETLTVTAGTNTGNWFSDISTRVNYKIGILTRTSSVIPFTGKIDEVRVYNRELSPSEIKQLYNFDSFYFSTPQKDSSLGAGLKLWYTFDGKDVSNGTFRDRSGNGNTGTPVSIATSTFYNKGNIGQGVFFNGSGSYVQPASDPIGLSTTTVSVWVNVNSFFGVDGSMFIIYGNNTRFRISNTGTRVEWSNNGFTNTCVSANINSTKNKWTHILVTRNESQVVNIYVNGVLSGTANQTCGSTSSALLGKIGISVTSTNKFIGYMDDLRVYNRVLGQQEITQLYNLGQAYFGQLSVDQMASLGKGLVGWWTFDGKNISNGTALDESGNGNTGQLINIATSTFYSTGKVGQGFKFDGVNDYLRISSTTPLQGFNPVTIAFWAKADTVALSKTPAAKHGDAGTNAEWIFKTTTSGSVFMRGIWYLSGGAIILTDTTVLDTRWHHWVLRGNGTIATLFKDGVQVATNSGTGTANSFSNSDIQIGRQDTVDAAYWPGKIDEFRVYNRALTANEIQTLYNMGQVYFKN